MICVSYSGQTDESKVEKDLFLSEGIASQAKITKEEARKLITSFSSVPEVAGYLPAFFYLPGEGEDERESEDLPPGTWGYVIGEKEVIDRKKGLAQAEVYLTKEFKVIGHKITGSIE